MGTFIDHNNLETEFRSYRQLQRKQLEHAKSDKLNDVKDNLQKKL